MDIPIPKKIYDISIPLHEGMITYPNNPEVKINEPATEGSLLTTITLGSHSGTHTDAPRHQHSGNGNVSDYPLGHYVGPALVIDCTHRGPGEVILPEDLDDHTITEGTRVLFKTSNSLRGYKEFYDDFVALGGDTAEILGDKNVALVGIDFLSIKKRGGSDNRAHTCLLEKKIPIIEGLDLSTVEGGEYFLSAAPLSLQDTEGAPLRALLLEF